MSDRTGIEWTATVNPDGTITPGATWNPIRGCTKVSPGCANCYAEVFAERWRGVKGHPYEQGFDLRLVPEKLTEPLRWKKPRRVFVNSMSDLFQDRVPDSYIDQVFAVMALAPRHTFQVLTKRAERMRDYMSSVVNGCGVAARISAAAQVILGFNGSVYKGKPAALPDADVFWIGSCNPPDLPYRERWILKTWPLKNVWLGVSVENQHFADERIPCLLQTPAVVRFISAEPLLAPLFGLGQWLCEGADSRPMWTQYCPVDEHGFARIKGLDWVIVGGESGNGARPFNMEWARSIIEQCKSANIPVFCKQMGAKAFEPYSDGTPFVECHFKSHKGGDMDEWPEDLRVREFPA